MSLEKVLTGWSEYTERKLYEDGDVPFFDCAFLWEVEFLAGRIKEVYPGVSPLRIIKAVRTACERLPAPRPRRAFVQAVLEELELNPERDDL